MTADHEERLDEIIADYLLKRETGESVGPEALIASHPEFADEIREFFADEAQMQGIASPLASPVISRRPVLDKIHYFGDYELIEEIARGGMGIVYKANQTSLNRIVAVKMILAGHLASETDAKRFQMEAESAASLKHSNIVAVHEVGRHDGQNYFSMDYIDGKNLSEITRDNPLPAKTAARYVHQIAQAIEFAHQQGTLHRDLKPSNVLIDSNDNVQITDFGLALRVDGDSQLTRTGQILGTPSYMPPEQAQNKRSLIGPGSDIYSLGAILYELLTGGPPFRAESAVETLRQVIETEPPSPRLLNPSVPCDLETICLKCLQKEPHKRYVTAQHLAEDLQRYLNSEPIVARPIGRVARAWRWCKRKPAVASLTATAAMLLVAVAIVSTVAYFREAVLRNAEAEARELAERQREEANRQRDAAQVARNAEAEARDLAEDNAEQSRQRLVRLNVANGVRLMDEGDLLGSLPWFVEALKLDQADPQRQQMHRLRLGTVLSHCPTLVQVWRNEGFPSIPFSADAEFSPDGRRVVSISRDNTARIWNVETGELVHRLEHGFPVYHTSFSRDSRRLLTAGGNRKVGHALVWDMATGKPVTPPLEHDGPVLHASFDPNGGLVITASQDNTARVWEARTGRPCTPPLEHKGPVLYASFSPDGQRAVTASQDTTAQIWDARSGESLSTLEHDFPISLASFSPDGQRVVTASNIPAAARVWDATTGKPVTQYMMHDGLLARASFSPDGRHVLTANWDATARVWDASTGELLKSLEHSTSVYDAQFSRDGRRVVVRFKPLTRFAIPISSSILFCRLHLR
jgi:WD40 repeat protein/tRNA A-37 threonylcarbamoyl transferase component Bud32